MSPAPWLDPAVVDLSTAIAASFHALSGSSLVEPVVSGRPGRAMSAAMYTAPFALLCHDGASDPLFTYANKTAQSLWSMTWAQMVGLPSRLSAQESERSSRAVMLRQAQSTGLITDYAGVRIASGGQRFAIRGATIWTVTDPSGVVLGQAAKLPHWQFLQD